MSCFDKQDPPGVWSGCSVQRWRGTQDGAQRWACSRACRPEERGRGSLLFCLAPESPVMDSLWLHTLALCIGASWTLSLFFFSSHNRINAHTHTHTLFLKQAAIFSFSWPRCGRCSLCCKASHCHHKQSLPCLVFLSLSLNFSFNTSRSYLCTVAMRWRFFKCWV